MNELISIIMPVYNVEPYLDKALCSVTNQTYKNLDIILVDDGSPDRCGQLCDKWALQDNRIRVIHKINGGAASAWNEGVAVARGDCIGFVDPDDWVEDTMFESLYNALQRFSVDIAVCGYYNEINNKSSMKQVEYTRYYTKEEALKEIIIDNVIQNFVWNKLYRRKCIPENPFPAIKRVSDMGAVYKFFKRADSVIQINQSFYHYVHRGDSLAGLWTTPEPFIDYTLSSQIRYEDLWQEFISIRKALAEKYIFSIRRIKKVCCSSSLSRVKENTSVIKNQIQPFYFTHLAEFRESESFTSKKEREITAFLLNPENYHVDAPAVKVRRAITTVSGKIRDLIKGQF